MKSLFNNSSYLVGPCAGTLVSPRVILSAFHCVQLWRTTKKDIRSCGVAVLGRHEIDLDVQVTYPDPVKLRKYKTIPITKVLAPPNAPLNKHDDDYSDHDFALMLLEHPAMYSSKVSPICLPEPHAEFGGLKATAAGWGSTDAFGTEQSPVLKAVELTVSPKQYKHTKMFGTKITGKDNQYQDVCRGDSGNSITFSKAYKIGHSCRRSPDVLQPDNLQICPDRHSVWCWL